MAGRVSLLGGGNSVTSRISGAAPRRRLARISNASLRSVAAKSASYDAENDHQEENED